MRVRPIWLWRLALGGFAVAYLASGTLQLWIPPIVPFLAAAAVEAQFFLSGRRRREAPTAEADRGPQARDLADFGWESLEPAASPPRRRTARRRLVQLVFVLMLLSGLFLLDRSRPGWQHLSKGERAATVALLDRQATGIAGNPARVICDTSGRRVGFVQEADGLAEVGGSRMWLTPDVCYRLDRIRATGRSAGTDSGHAVAVLAHEAWHLHGTASESTANCYAYQSGVGVGQSLGLDAGTARRLMREQLADNPADYADDPAYKVTAGCRRGGSLDLHLDGSHFP